MASCSGCGAHVPDGTAFCQQCGRPMGAQSHQQAAPPQHNSGEPATAGLQENVASALCYVVGWVTGIIFLLIDKRPNVRFHAAQSIVVFGGLSIIYYIVLQAFAASIMWGSLGAGWSLGYTFFWAVRVLMLVLWILLMIKAYQGERFRIPVAADIADSLTGKVKA